MDEDESALEFGTNSGYVETIRQLAKEGKQEELSREVQAWVHDDWSWLHRGHMPHEAPEKIAEQEFSEQMVLLERLVILLQPFLRQCATAAFWQVQDSLRSVQRHRSALQSKSSAVHDAVEQLRREVEALRMPVVQSHGNEEPQSLVCVAVARSAPGSSSLPKFIVGERCCYAAVQSQGQTRTTCWASSAPTSGSTVLAEDIGRHRGASQRRSTLKELRRCKRHVAT